MRLTQQSGKRKKQKANIRIDIKNWRHKYRESSEWINSSSWKACANMCGDPKKGVLKQFANYRITRKQDPFSDHTGKDPTEHRKRNCR